MIKVSYRENEWLAVYVDENGDRQIMPFNTYAEAEKFARKIIENYGNVIGVMTTRFYNHFVEEIIDKA